MGWEWGRQLVQLSAWPGEDLQRLLAEGWLSGWVGRQTQQLKWGKIVGQTADVGGRRWNKETLTVCLGNCRRIEWRNTSHLSGVMGENQSAIVQCSPPEILLVLWLRICKTGTLQWEGNLAVL